MKKMFYLLVAVVIVWGGYIYSQVYHFGVLKSIYSTLSLFLGDVEVPDGKDNLLWWQDIYIVGLLAILVTSWVVIALYLKIIGKTLYRFWMINRKNPIVVIGLGEGNRAYIDSELNVGNSDIIVIEADKNNPYIEHYGSKILVEVADASKSRVLQELKVQNKKHIVISTGSDVLNISIAQEILHLNSEAKIFLHLNSKSFKDYQRDGGILEAKNIKIFSYYEEAARELFESVDIDGFGKKIIKSDKKFAIAVVGNTKLAHEVVAQACIVGQLPNENRLTIYCIDKDAKSFREALVLEFKNIESVPNVSLEFIETDYTKNAFYEHSVWQKELTNIVLCFEEENANLAIANHLTNFTFIDAIVAKKFNTKIAVAMSASNRLSESLVENDELYKHICTFAQSDKCSSREYIVSQSRNDLAIAINYIYNNIGANLENYDEYKYNFYRYDGKAFNENEYLDINIDNWHELSYFKKESNRAVADHIKTKLKYLGLKLKKSDEHKEILFKVNKKIFDEKLTDIVKLAKSEHYRWNAFHFLHGFKKIDFVTKAKKKALEKEYEKRRLHMCLVQFDEFKARDKELQKLGYTQGQFEGYDVMIVKFIPHIASFAGYELVERA